MGLDFLSMPAYISSGSHEHDGIKYRFLVMEKYGSDLGKFLIQHKKFPPATLFNIGIQIVSIMQLLGLKNVTYDVIGLSIETYAKYDF